MTQQSPTLANQSGASYRGQANDAREALMDFHKGSGAPSYAAAGMIWCDDSATPWLYKVYDGTDWITLFSIDASTNKVVPYFEQAALAAASETVKGLVERATDAEAAAGTDTSRYVTPKQLADNVSSGFPSAGYTDASNAYSDGTTYEHTHGLGGVPSHVEVRMVCTSADSGYAVGDEIPIAINGHYNNRGVTAALNGTKIKLSFGGSGVGVADGSTGADVVLDDSKWQYTVRAWA